MIQTSFLLIICAFTLVGCGPLRPSNSTHSRPSVELPNYTSEAIAAIGWNLLSLQANGATSKLDASGHFITDRNMCQLRGDGALDLKTWNAFAKTLNPIATTGPATSPSCITYDQESRFYSPGKAEVTLEDKKVLNLVELKEGQLCFGVTLTFDQQKELMQLLEVLINRADQADASNCPNYRP